MNPRVTQQQWMVFAARHAGEAYKSGYVRGLEWKHRAPGQMEPWTAWSVSDSDERRHDWSWADLAPSEEQLQQMVEDNADVIERLSPEDRVLYQDVIGRQLGTHCVVLIPTDDPKQR